MRIEYERGFLRVGSFELAWSIGIGPDANGAGFVKIPGDPWLIWNPRDVWLGSLHILWATPWSKAAGLAEWAAKHEAHLVAEEARAAEAEAAWPLWAAEFSRPLHVATL